MTCMATRPKTHDPGWECTGDDLVVMLAPGTLPPVVAPAWAVDALLAGPHGDAFDPQSFGGGDHLHLVIPQPA